MALVGKKQTIPGFVSDGCTRAGEIWPWEYTRRSSKGRSKILARIRKNMDTLGLQTLIKDTNEKVGVRFLSEE